MFDDEAQIRAEIDAVLDEKDVRLKRLLFFTNACYWAAHIFLGLGIIAIVLVAYCTGK